MKTLEPTTTHPNGNGTRPQINGSGSRHEARSPASLPNADSSPPPRSRKPWRIIPSPKYLKLLTSGGKGPTNLWGTLVPRETVILLVGETSAGKTVFVHGLGYALSTGTDLLGMTPPRPLRVLHVDVESPGPVTRKLLRSIGTNERWHFAKVKRERHVLRMLKTVGRQYDVIIVDSIMVASPVNEENSNSEGNRQMVPFVKLARRTKAAILLLHNSGEGNPKEKFKSRGATARVDRADIVVNLDDLGQGKRRLKVVKSRYPNLGQTLEYEIDAAPGAPYGYRLTKSLDQPATKQERLERLVSKACQIYRTRSLSRQQIAQVTRVDLADKGKSKLLNRSLKTLVERGRLRQPQRGQYQAVTTP
jgi:archaellum biogenesis ATPase FlaH